ncbi:hypothetical protein MAR_025130, partial [Mya arenaria]
SIRLVNIPERVQHNGGRTFEDTESELCTFLSDKMHLNDVKFERVHRMGPIRQGGQARVGTRYGINEQFQDEVEEKRKQLYPVLRQIRRDNQKVVLVKDKLFVDGA